MMEKYLKSFMNREHEEGLKENKELNEILQLDIKHFYPVHAKRFNDIRGFKIKEYDKRDQDHDFMGGIIDYIEHDIKFFRGIKIENKDIKEIE